MKKNIVFAVLAAVFALCQSLDSSGQVTQKPISRSQLETFLSKSINISHFNDLCKPESRSYNGEQIVDPAESVPNNLQFDRFNDMLRVVQKVRPLFISDALTQWGPWDLPYHLKRCSITVDRIKAVDPDIIVQGAVNEFMDLNTVNNQNIPAYVFQEFGLPYTQRFFDIYQMAYSDYLTNSAHHWVGYPWQNGKPTAIKPDITRIESQMWYFFLATQFINYGCESINFSDINQIDDNAGNYAVIFQLCNRLRHYANSRQNIRFLLLTAHKEYKLGNDLCFDFFTSPTRVSEVGSPPTNANGGNAILTYNSCSPWGKSFAGRTPSGWECVHTPTQVFLDNYNNGGNPPNTWGTLTGNCWQPYRFDEISWFAMQPQSYRDDWLRYAYYKTRCLDENSFLSLPVKRIITVQQNGQPCYDCHYFANNPNGKMFGVPNTINGLPDKNNAVPYAGYSQEDRIRDILNGSLAGPNDWVHHNFTNENIISQPNPHVQLSLIMVGNDKMYYIANDQRIHGYIWENGVWKTVSPSHAANVSVNNQMPAKSNLIASPNGQMLVYIGTDNKFHGFYITNQWNYVYFDFMVNDMNTQGLSALGSAIFTPNGNIFYLGKHHTGEQYVHGFWHHTNGTWTTVSPTFSAEFVYGQLASQQMQVKGSITYDPATDRLYYRGLDDYFYYYDIISDWQYMYYVVPKNQMITQNLKITGDLAYGGGKMYYKAGENGGGGAQRMHAVYQQSSVWMTVSPTHSAAIYNGQPLSTQEQMGYFNIAVSPNEQNFAYVDYNGTIHFYRDLGSSNYSYNTCPVPYYYSGSNSYFAHNSLQYRGDNEIFYISDPMDFLYPGDRKVHSYRYQEDYCSNAGVHTIEPWLTRGTFNSYAMKQALYDQDSLAQGAVDRSPNPAGNDAKEDNRAAPQGVKVVKTLPDDVSIKLFPNPANSFLKIMVQSNAPVAYRYQISDLLGRTVASGNIGENISSVDLTGISAGAYFIVLSDNAGLPVFNSKFMVIK